MNGKEISIRAAIKEDLLPLSDLILKFEREFGGIIEPNYEPTLIQRKHAESRYLNFMGNLGDQILIAELGEGNIVGYMMFNHNRSTAQLLEIYVKPTFRGNGIGGRLVLQLEQLVRPRGASALEAQIHPGSHIHQQALLSGWKEALWEEEGSSQELITISRRLV